MMCCMWSCTEPEEEDVLEEVVGEVFIDPLEGLPDEGELNFTAPEVGQRSRFVLFKATYSYETAAATFTYQPDTLVVAITEKKTDRWIVKQFLTAGSDSRVNKYNGFWGNMVDSVFQSNLKLENDSIYFYRDPEDWFITYAFPRPQKFPLSPVSGEAPERDNAWPLFTGSNPTRWTAFITNYDHRGKVFPRLNIYFNYTETGFDGWGYTYVYGPSDGLVRIAWVYAWTLNEAAGWDVIPRE